MFEARKRQFFRAHASTDAVLTFEQEDAQAGTSQSDSSRKSIRTGTNNHGVIAWGTGLGKQGRHNLISLTAEPFVE